MIHSTTDYHIFSEIVSNREVDPNWVNKLAVTTQKKWHPQDYLNYFCIEKNPNYQELSNLLNKFPQLTIGPAYRLLTGSQKYESLAFRSGEMMLQPGNKAEEICECLKALRNAGVVHAFDRNFIYAYMSAYEAEGFEPDVFLHKVRQNIPGFFKCADVKQYLQIIEDFYNYRNSKNLIRIR